VRTVVHRQTQENDEATMRTGDHHNRTGWNEQQWSALYTELSAFLSKRSLSSPYGEGDYWLLDDNWGNGEHLLYIYREDFLNAELVHGIKQILAKFTLWKVVISVDLVAPDKKKVPPMGMPISNDGIKVDLKREFLTGSLRNVKFL
jgi:hypothetical protein